MSNEWTRVRYDAEEVSLPTAWVDTWSDEDQARVGIGDTEDSWRDPLRLDSPAALIAAGEYDALTVEQLDQRIDAINESRDNDDLLAKGRTKADRVAALEKADDDTSSGV